MTRVITYGTYDLFHEGHKRLLERAKELGDYLIVGVTSTAFDESRGKLDVSQSLVERIENVRKSGVADEIIVEEFQGQKIRDIIEHKVDIFTVGSDWMGKFDYLNEYCKVVYLDRTKGVSSTKLRSEEGVGIQRLGIVGAGRVAHRFIAEVRYVSGLEVDSVYDPDHAAAMEFVQKYDLRHAAPDYDEMLNDVGAVYIASPHASHVEYARKAIDAGVHVLCEKPLSLTAADAEDLYARAEANSVVLLEAIKTAFCPGFRRMVVLARSGSIGQIRSIDATFTKLMEPGREFEGPDGGAISELATFPLLAAVKLLGTEFEDVRTTKLVPEGSDVDTFARIDLRTEKATATCRAGIGVKAEGSLVVAGTEGYVYVPAPWWLTNYYEERFEEPGVSRRYYYAFDGDGMRYEISEFHRMIREGRTSSFMLTPQESIAIARLIETARADNTAVLR
ncbi:MAG: Gfo/Idh/MocA family oxidoreductase [Cellulomonadaceae bacterium]|jgi:glycerol-3-phosphate cytidylyltransferase|nr:Gfo/Idh/MocA family oxidoreductase [Cellulomonadaceae bacterium]